MPESNGRAMRPLLLFAVVLLFVASMSGNAASAQPTPGPCRMTGPKAVELSDPELSASFAPTASQVRYLLDLGSDGRVRHARTIATSGDAALDAAALQALQRSTFAPAKEFCIAVSSVFEFYFDLSAYNASPRPDASPLPASSMPPAEPCMPFVQGILTRFKPPPNAKGTVAIDVSLDAQANVRKASVSRSSGDATLDELSRKVAQRAEFAFHRQPGCKPAATTYTFEMTYTPAT